MVASNTFTFVPDVRAFVTSDALVARVAGDIRTSQQLFDLLYRVLTLPGYFGFNWNALFDCLRDFHWINERMVLIVHDDVPALALSEMKIYLEVLRDAVTDWKPGEAHALQVVFDEKDRARIENALAGA
ncbi:barstar family protein [Paraburkholderia strydomiana]|uniref:barstar family protein n=1 Tax=Paraburkholderia strydomiana TaxID=1245417 RepID=UPI0038BC8825